MLKNQPCSCSQKTADDPVVRPTSSSLTFKDLWIHIQARWGIRRGKHRVEPGLYALGKPGKDDPVLVTANYTLSFDALRRRLKDLNAWILVLNTYGINVWCAAGKGTFGTGELVERAAAVGLKDVVSHRRLILPQLGAPGVSAHEVKRMSGFQVQYGPVCAADLPEYLSAGCATPETRRVGFSIADRLLLIPVELIKSLFPGLLLTLAAWWLGGVPAAAAMIAAVLAGTVLFPVLLPWIPTQDFSSKGYILGAAAILPILILMLPKAGMQYPWQNILFAAALLLVMPAVTAFFTLNFTGSTTFTSKSRVKREMKIYIPMMAWTTGPGLVILIGLKIMALV